MKRYLSWILLISLCVGSGLTLLSAARSFLLQPPDYSQLKTEAEKYYAEGSYARANALYAQAGSIQLPEEEARWVQFRIADTLWRAQAATETPDPTQYENAKKQLEMLIRDIDREDRRDRVWAEVHESLGDYHWTRRDLQDWGNAFPHYQQALDWWAGYRDVETARTRYLSMVWKMADPSWRERYYGDYYYVRGLPITILDNALEIAQSSHDKARAHFLIAMSMKQQGGDWFQLKRVPQEFEAAIKLGKSTPWYDDALFHYANWMNNYGQIIVDENGSWRYQLDYIKALALYRQLVTEFPKGKSPYYDQAQEAIKTITDASLSIHVANAFLPGSEIRFNANWRNTKQIHFTLYQADLSRHVQYPTSQTKHPGSWLQQIDLSKRTPLRSWSKNTSDKGDYHPGQTEIRLDQKLPVGAYILEAKAGTRRVRDIILVTDTSLVVRTAGPKAVLYFCNAIDGSPVPNARVLLWQGHYVENRYVWNQSTGTTNEEGLAVFDLKKTNAELFAAAWEDGRQAFSLGNSYFGGRERDRWRIYAFTDRPAYRPNETVQWKIIARQYDGSTYSTPANESLFYTLYDPKGTKIKEEIIKTNAFGSAWNSCELPGDAPLGQYRVEFHTADKKRGIGSAILFRVEEYKLPEFKVSVQTPEEDGKKKAFRMGEKVEVEVQADYYFGGPVADAKVEVIVRQLPYYQWWYPHREYAWYYNNDYGFRGRGYYGGGQVVKQEIVKTDSTGKAKLTIDTPPGSQYDLQYQIEARVTDSSRREIVGNGSVRVTRQRYYVYPRPKHNLYQPKDKVTVDFKTLDANEQPIAAEGKVKITRDHWMEVWRDPQGREVKEAALQKLQEKHPVFPPPNQRGWQLIARGYKQEVMLNTTVKTDAKGEAELSFVTEREGYYRIAWGSRDKDGTPIKAETTVWVASKATTALGYRHAGVEIIVDKDTFQAGQKASVLISCSGQDRYVLFSVESEAFHSYQLVHVTGAVKLVELPITEKHVPNVFLNAMMVHSGELFGDTKEVVVPPVRNFLTVEVKPDRTQYQPQEEGTLTVSTKDHTGKPVSAEVALGLTDEAVYYIQQDYAIDPRQFYFGSKRPHIAQMQSTFNQKRYTKLIPAGDKEDALYDLYQPEERGNFDGGRWDSFEGGLMGNLGQPGGSAGRGGGGFGVGFRNRDQAGAFIGADLNAPGSPPSSELLRMAKSEMESQENKAVGVEQESAVQVRTDFRSTVLWQPDVVTGQDGKATVKVKYPDSLTGWRAVARVATTGNQFGMATGETRTKMPLMIRLQAPRFFVAGDKAVISAVINNYTEKALDVDAVLDVEGVKLSGTPAIQTASTAFSAMYPLLATPHTRTAVLPNGEKRVDWLVDVQEAGKVKLRVSAKSGTYGDAMERTYTAYEHGIEKFVSKSGKVRGSEVLVKLHIPQARKPGSTSLTVQVTPSMAVTMLDALPYLINYPYGCTEQTMSRFMPTAVVAKTLHELGLQPEEVMGKVFGGVEPETAGKTHPDGKKSLQQMNAMIKDGLNRLYDFQHADGGWGWWKEGRSDHFMSAYVVWGLVLARDAGIDIRQDVLEKGVRFLDIELVEQESAPDLQTWMLHALAEYHLSIKANQISEHQKNAFDNLWGQKDKLNAYTRALLALSANAYGYREQALTLVRNLENGVVRDNRPDESILIPGSSESRQDIMGTAHWGRDGIYYRWSDGGVEATAFALRAMLAIDPQNELIEPIVNWLIKNRRGAQWSNTRDTAIVVLTLNDYLRKSGELATETEYELFVNGQSIRTQRVTPQDILRAPSLFNIRPELIQDGVNEIKIIRKSGSGALYFAANAQFFSLEEPITPAGNEIFVRRQYFRITTRPTLLKGFVNEKTPLNDGETLQSGDRVEVVMMIEAKNNYEYLLFEDLKPAGLEAVQIRSGEPLYTQQLKSGSLNRAANAMMVMKPEDYTGESRWVYQELRDRKAAFFIDRLPQGVWEIRYELRAEVPGAFHALPVLGHAMYVPEIRCNGSEVRVSVRD